MTVGRICTREVDLARPGEKVTAAAQRMDARQVGTLVVLDDDRVPVGILTDRDLAVRVLGGRREPDETRVRDVMTAAPATVEEETPIEDALRRMRELAVRRMPVVDLDGRLVGLVSLDDILGLLVEELSQMGGILQHSGPRGLAGF